MLLAPQTANDPALDTHEVASARTRLLLAYYEYQMHRMATATQETSANTRLQTLRDSLLADHYRNELRKMEEHRSAIRRSTSASGKIFWVVHIIVFLAVGITTWEVVQAARIRGHSRREHQLTISLQGLAVRTALQGIVLLAIALAFYYLYLRFVYPIQPITP